MWVREYDEQVGVYININADPQGDPDDIWEEHYDQDGSLYFYNRKTFETSWELPEVGLVAHYEATQSEYWTQYYDEGSGHYYYVHSKTGGSSWERPQGQDIYDPYTDTVVNEPIETEKQDYGQAQYDYTSYEQDNNYYCEDNYFVGSTDQAIPTVDTITPPENNMDEQQEEIPQQQAIATEEREELEEASQQPIESSQPTETETMNDEMVGSDDEKCEMTASNDEKDENVASNDKNRETVASNDENHETVASNDEKHETVASNDERVKPNGEMAEVVAAKDEEELGPAVQEEAEEEENSKERISKNQQEDSEQDAVRVSRALEEEKLSETENVGKTKPVIVVIKRGRPKASELEKAASQSLLLKPVESTVVQQKQADFVMRLKSKKRDTFEGRAKDLFAFIVERGNLEPVNNESGAKKKLKVPRKVLLRLLCHDPSVRIAFREDIEGLDGIFRPATFRADFEEADANGDGLLSRKEFVNFCVHRRIKKRTLRPYNERVTKNKVDYETLPIKIRIPDSLRNVIDEKYEKEAYSHFERRRKWDRNMKSRQDAFKKERDCFWEELDTRKTEEREKRQKFEKVQKEKDSVELRERKKMETCLVKEKNVFLRAETTRKLDIENGSDGSLDSKSETNAIVPVPPPHLKHLKNIDQKSKKHLETFRSQKNINIEEGQFIADEKVIHEKLSELDTKKRKEFEHWHTQKNLELESAITERVNARVAHFLKRKQRAAQEEAERRLKVDEEFDRLEKEQLAKEERFNDETEELGGIDRALRKLEDTAYMTIQRQRKHFLHLASICFDRSMLRKLTWHATLKECGQLNRTVHHLKDSANHKDDLALITFPCLREGEDTMKMVEIIRTFQEAGTPTLMTTAQRHDDRCLQHSKYLVQVTNCFTHKVQSFYQMFIFTRYYNGGRLKDVIDRLYGDPNQVRKAPETLLLQWAEQLANAVRVLHDRGLSHGGIDPSCIFIDPKQRNCVRLGLPKDIRGMKTDFSPVVTTYYSPPEFSQDLRRGSTKGSSSSSRDEYDPRYADLWSLGAVVYHLAAGEPLPPKFELSKLVSKPSIQRYGRWLRSLLRMILQKKPQDRADIVDVVDLFYDASDNLMMIKCER